VKVLSLISDARKSRASTRLTAGLNKYSGQGDTFEKRLYSDLVVTIKDDEVRIFFIDDHSDLTGYDLIYLWAGNKALRHTIALYMRNYSEGAVVNSESYTFQSMTKLEQNVLLALNNVPVPDSVYTINRENYYKAIELAGFDFPLVVKAIDGNNGDDNEIVATKTDLRRLQFNDVIIQPFIPNDFDYRVVVTGSDIATAYKRIRSGEGYKNNISQGGSRQIAELSPDLKNLAIRAAHAMGREFCGLDILTNKVTGRSVVLEVNFTFGTPEFGDEKVEEKFYNKILQYFHSMTDDRYGESS
jgi:glutathione synthase/RimK-type ligase-like ATP-grasp enzyme